MTHKPNSAATRALVGYIERMAKPPACFLQPARSRQPTSLRQSLAPLQKIVVAMSHLCIDSMCDRPHNDRVRYPMRAGVGHMRPIAHAFTAKAKVPART